MKITLAIIALALLFGCDKPGPEPPHHASMPPGWTLVCDNQGHFGAQFPHSSYVIPDGSSEPLATNRQEVIDLAWDRYEYYQTHRDKPLIVVPWRDCESKP